MYNKIANYYDELGWADYAEVEIDVINNLFMNNNLIPEKICDLGCGTGELIYKMNDIYEDTSFIGVDLSDDMLQIAKKKCKDIRNIKFFSKDMRNFKLDSRVDAITCMYDTINHLIKKEHWQDTFKSVYESLKYGGMFILDVVPVVGLEKWEGTYVKDLKEGTLIRKIELDPLTNIITTHINAFIKTNYFGTYKNIKEDVKETSFKVEEIILMLKEAGFKKIELYDQDLVKHKFLISKLNKEERIYISAMK